MSPINGNDMNASMTKSNENITSHKKTPFSPTCVFTEYILLIPYDVLKVGAFYLKIHLLCEWNAAFAVIQK